MNTYDTLVSQSQIVIDHPGIPSTLGKENPPMLAHRGISLG